MLLRATSRVTSKLVLSTDPQIQGANPHSYYEHGGGYLHTPTTRFSDGTIPAFSKTVSTPGEEFTVPDDYYNLQCISNAIDEGYLEIVHFDIEPSEVLVEAALQAALSQLGLTGTEPKIEDFMGIATVNDGDQAFTGGLGAKPIGDIEVEVNGVGVTVGDGTAVGVDCYFTSPSDMIPRTFDGTVQAGDILRWNGSVAKYQVDSGDEISLEYNVIRV